jgi:hypothetical protein
MKLAAQLAIGCWLVMVAALLFWPPAPAADGAAGAPVQVQYSSGGAERAKLAVAESFSSGAASPISGVPDGADGLTFTRRAADAAADVLISAPGGSTVFLLIVDNGKQKAALANLEASGWKRQSDCAFIRGDDVRALAIYKQTFGKEGRVTITGFTTPVSVAASAISLAAPGPFPILATPAPATKPGPARNPGARGPAQGPIGDDPRYPGPVLIGNASIEMNVAKIKEGAFFRLGKAYPANYPIEITNADIVAAPPDTVDEMLVHVPAGSTVYVILTDSNKIIPWKTDLVAAGWKRIGDGHLLSGAAVTNLLIFKQYFPTTRDVTFVGAGLLRGDFYVASGQLSLRPVELLRALANAASPTTQPDNAPIRIGAREFNPTTRSSTASDAVRVNYGTTRATLALFRNPVVLWNQTRGNVPDELIGLTQTIPADGVREMQINAPPQSTVYLLLSGTSAAAAALSQLGWTRMPEPSLPPAETLRGDLAVYRHEASAALNLTMAMAGAPGLIVAANHINLVPTASFGRGRAGTTTRPDREPTAIVAPVPASTSPPQTPTVRIGCEDQLTTPVALKDGMILNSQRGNTAFGIPNAMSGCMGSVLRGASSRFLVIDAAAGATVNLLIEQTDENAAIIDQLPRLGWTRLADAHVVDDGIFVGTLAALQQTSAVEQQTAVQLADKPGIFVIGAGDLRLLPPSATTPPPATMPASDTLQ